MLIIHWVDIIHECRKEIKVEKNIKEIIGEAQIQYCDIRKDSVVVVSSCCHLPPFISLTASFTNWKRLSDMIWEQKNTWYVVKKGS